MKRYLGFALAMVCAAQVGKQPDGSFMLPTGWRIHPAGEQVPLDTLPMSSAISPDGKFLLVLNGGYKPPSISVLTVSPPREIQRVPVADGWLGLAFSPNGRQVYVGGGSRSRVFEFTFSPQGELKPSREFEVTPAAQRTHADFIGDVAVSPDGRLIYAADLYHDAIVVINPQSGRVIERYKTGRRPYRILFHPDGKSFFVSSWADGTVYLHSATTGSEEGRIRLGPHTTDMVLSDRKLPDEDDPPLYRLFVAASNTNSVFVVAVSEAKGMKLIETMNVALTPRNPLGMTPSAVALSPDQTKLLVTCSDANVVAVADISGLRSLLTGFLPTGEYPTATRVLADGHVVVLNGRGTMSVIDPLTDETLDAYTKTARSLSPYRDDSKPEKLPPIEHVLYIVRENRGYDDESAAPNHSKLAREFVLFDNFFVNADASAEGHNWATAGIATDYTQKLWPNSYAKRRDHYDYEGGEPANTPPAGYLWGNALSAGLSVRNYGYFVDNRAKVGSDGVQIDGVRDPALRSVTNTHYRGFDLDYPDVERARVFLEDLRQFESSGTMPRLMIMRLGNDHTDGTAPGKFADNDYALGLIVEGISKSRFWPATAIFVVEAAAPNGPDHVDSNRSPMLALSPYTRRGIVDSTMYNQSSVLRTIELILGMRPLTHFDAGARPLTAAFASAPNTAAYTAEQPRIRSDSLRQ